MIYAVNKQTKEHRLYDYGDECSEHHEIIAADKDGWIEWRGGVCPLPNGHPFELRFGFSPGVATTSQNPARWSWSHNGAPGDIIAYRPILNNDKPQATEWGGEGLPPVGTVCEVYIANRDAWEEVEVKVHSDGLALFRNGTGGHYYGRTAEHYRPIRTDREKRVNQAAEVALQTDDALGDIYDALKSGDLPQP